MSACLVVGAEEADWLTADVLHHFKRSTRLAEGAGAVLLRRGSPGPAAVRLAGVTNPCSFVDRPTRAAAAERVSAELAPVRPNELVCAEPAFLRNWEGMRLEVQSNLGEGFAAAAAWQCIAAIGALRPSGCSGAVIGVTGAYQESIGARFTVDNTPSSSA